MLERISYVPWDEFEKILSRILKSDGLLLEATGDL